MDFRVLGPLEVCDGERALRLGGRRQRMVLAALLLRVNRTASIDWLIDAVWGESPPSSSRKTLQVYVARLRKVLGEGLLATALTGYSLKADSGQIDAFRFEELAREGQELLESDPAGAATILRQALALWSGMPWGEFGDEPAFQPEAQRLTELRLAAVEDRIEADAALGFSAQLIGELHGLVGEHPWRERSAGQLMLALYRTGRQAEALRTYQDTRRLLGEELGIEPSIELQRIEEQILLHDQALAVATSGPVLDLSPVRRNPYKGLRPFTENDAADFFGRVDLVERLTRWLEHESFVAVVGASGSGKSSLVTAGLVPALRSGDLPGSQDWLITTMRPGDHPFDELVAALYKSDEGIADVEGECFVGDDLDLLRASLSMVPEDDSRVVLVIDQFEELFSLTSNADARARFVRNIVEAVDDPSSRLTVVITLRADFMDRALDQSSLGPLLAEHMFNLLPLSASEVEAACVRPARGVGLALEPELIAELVGVTTRQPGVLPLLQYTLTELYESRASDVLSIAAYRDLGGIEGALIRRADDTYSGLDADHREACRQVFLRLVSLGEDGRHGQRTVLLADLQALDLSEGHVDTVLTHFDEARLLSFDRDGITNRPTIELAHEALLREWPQLRFWISEAVDDLRLHRSLEMEVLEWESVNRDPGYLLTGSRLEVHRSSHEHSTMRLTSAERDFIQASIRLTDEQRSADAARRESELALERRASRRLRWLVAIVSVAALVAVSLTVYATGQRRNAEASEREARTRELANASVAQLEADPELSILLALAAIDVSRSSSSLVLPEAENALHAAIGAHRLLTVLPHGTDLVFLSGGHLLVGGDPTRVWNLTTESSVLTLPDTAGLVLSVAASHDGARLVTGTYTGSVSLWDLAGTRINTLAASGRDAHAGAVTGLAFAPDDTLLASVSPVDRTVRVWDVASGRLLEEVPEPEPSLWDVDGPLLRLAFDPSGTRIAITGANDGTVWVYDLETSTWSLTLSGHDPVAIGVEFLVDGTRLVTGAYDEKVKVWDAESGREIYSIDTGVGWVIGLDVSPDGSVLAAGGLNGQVEVWRLSESTAQQMATLAGHDSWVGWVDFDDTGSRLATSGDGENVRVWDVDGEGGSEWALFDGRAATFSNDGRFFALAGPGRDVSILDADTWSRVSVLSEAAPSVAEREESSWVSGIAFSPDGATVATASHSFGRGEGLVRLWDVTTGQPIRTLSDSIEPFGSVSFSPDGTKLAAALCSEGSPAQVWDVSDGALIFSVPRNDCGHAVDFHPDGRSLAVQVAGALENVEVWNLDTGETATESISHLPRVLGSAEFSPDGDRLVTAGADGRARVWDAESGMSLDRFEGHAGAAERAVWSPDGRSAATGDAAGVVRIWDVTTGELELSLDGHDSMIVGLSYSPDGKRLVSTDDKGLVRVWAIDVDDLILRARDRLTRGFTSLECTRYHFDACPTGP